LHVWILPEATSWPAAADDTSSTINEAL
jgi:hypothetical protein